MANFGGDNQFGQHNNDGFFSALRELAGNVQKHRIASSVDAANQRVQEIKSTMQPGAEQRAALTNTAQDIFMSMTSMGADPNAAALVYQNLVPKSYSTVDAALLSGDPYEQEAAKQIQADQELRNARMEQQKWDHQMIMTDKLEAGRDRRAEMAATRAENRAMSRPNTDNLKAAAQLSTVVQGLTNYNKAASQGVDGSGTWSNLWNKHVPGMLQTDTYQRMDQAKAAVINAALRRESGATIRDDEFMRKEAELFPVSGEGTGTRLQKKAAQQTLLQGLAIQAGPAATNVLTTVPGGHSFLGTNQTNLTDPNPQFKLGPNKYATPPRRR